MKKLFALALAALMAFSVVAIAAEEDIMLISEEEGVALEEVMPSYLTTLGEVTEINAEENYVIVKNEADEIRFNMDENTLLIGNDGASRFELATGKMVAVSHSMAMTMSIPAQSYAFAIVEMNETGMGNPIYAVVEEVKESENGVVLVTDAGSKEITVSKEAQVLPFLTRNIVRIEDVKAGSRVLLFYDMLTMSIPAYATTEKVVILPELVIEEAEEIPANVVVLANGEKVEIKEDEEIYEVEGVKMIPLRTVAEALGFEVVWDAEGQSINLVKETFSSMIRIGDVEGGINRARLVLEVAPQLPADKTYVPVSYINAVLEALSL
jgi:predicted RNA-binding protein